MNKQALYHICESEYSFPLDEKKLKLRFRTMRDDDIASIDVFWNVSFRIYKEQKITPMALECVDDLFAYYTATIEADIPAYSYVFRLTLQSGKIYFYSERGLSHLYDFAFAHIDSFRMGFINKNDIILENEAFKGAVFYQIFPERFCSLDKNIDKSHVNRPWDTLDLKSQRSDVIQDVFIGGDLKGIISKLEYLKDLGVDAIYMTPITKGDTNHKYDVVDYYNVDKMFGTNEDLLNLVDAAHKLQMKVVLDLVFNHSSMRHEMFQDVIKRGKNSPYYNFYFVDGDKPTREPLNYYCFAAVWGMPKLNSNNYDEQAYFVDVGKHFIQKYNIDGYRLDVANEVSHDFWINFKRELLKIKPNIILIGECWYNSHAYLRANEFESVMNYPFLNACVDYFVTRRYDAEKFAERLNNLLMRYQDNSNRMMLNLLDSHDVERFYDRVAPNKDLYFLAVVTLIMYVGWPMIYYGDEILMKGGPDPHNRKGMEWTSQEYAGNDYQLFRRILHLRKDKLVREGDIKITNVGSLFSLSRYIGDERIVLLINNSDSPLSYEVPNKEIVLSNGYNAGTFKDYSFVIYKTSKNK